MWVEPQFSAIFEESTANPGQTLEDPQDSPSLDARDYQEATMERHCRDEVVQQEIQGNQIGSAPTGTGRTGRQHRGDPSPEACAQQEAHTKCCLHHNTRIPHARETTPYGSNSTHQVEVTQETGGRGVGAPGIMR